MNRVDVNGTPRCAVVAVKSEVTSTVTSTVTSALTQALALMLALALSLSPHPAFAQSKTGTAIGQFLLIEPSARMAGMGNAGVALTEGIQSVYFNAATIGELPGSALQITHSEWFAGIDYDYAAAAFSIGSLGNVFASVTAVDSGEIDVRTVAQPLGTGERYSVDDVAVGLGFGRHVTDRFSAGVQVNYVEESIWHSSLRTLTLNVGTVYALSPSGLNLGASLSNYGTRARFSGRDLAIQYDNVPGQNGDNSSLPGERLTDEFPVPVLFRVGLSYPRQTGDRSRLILAVDGSHPSDNTEYVSAGGEWTWREALAIRAGYQNLAQEDTETGLTLGAGLAGSLGERRFHFDYAWADQGRLEESHRLTFVVTF